MKPIPKKPAKIPEAAPADASLQAGILFAQGKAKHGKNQIQAAEHLYRAALQADPKHADAMHLLGVVAQQMGRYDESIELISKASKARPKEAAILVNLGASYRKSGDIEKAREVYERALKLNPNLPEVYFNFARTYFDSGDKSAAIPLFKKYLEFRPKDVVAIVDLANAQRYGRQYEEALRTLDAALALDPNNAKAYQGIGAVFRDKADYFSAILGFEKAVSLDPRLHEAHFTLANVLLQTGQLEKGWRHYDARFFDAGLGENLRKRAVPPVYWEGESLEGKSILIWPEQGPGDQILFSSIFPDVLAQARKVIIQSKVRLIPIFQRSFPSATVLLYDFKDPARNAIDEPVDYQIAAGSLGRYFRNDFASFPQRGGYLVSDPVLTSKLRARYEEAARGRRIVGLSWKSKNPNMGQGKSVELLSWKDVLTTPDVLFVNLQYGDCSADLAAVEKDLGIKIFNDPEVDPLTDMESHFAQVAAMDLVVSTSNTTVHTAGSINKPTWVVLDAGPRAISPWCWLLEREDTPWYPSVKIYRRAVDSDPAGDEKWSGVMERVSRDLKAWSLSKS